MYKRQITDRFAVRQGDSARFGIGIDDRSIPRAAADLLLRIKQKPRIFNTDRVGSYLLARGLKVFIDSRAVGNILPEYLAILEHPERFALAVREYKLNAAVIDIDNRSIAAMFVRDPEWRLVHFDAQALVFFKKPFGPLIPTIDPCALLASLRADLPPVEQQPRFWQRAQYAGTRIAAARILSDMAAPVPALALLEDALRLDPRRFTDWSLLADARKRSASTPDSPP